MSVSCECCVLLGRGHCDGPTTLRGVLPSVSVSLSVIRYNNYPLDLRVGKNRSD